MSGRGHVRLAFLAVLVFVFLHLATSASTNGSVAPAAPKSDSSADLEPLTEEEEKILAKWKQMKPRSEDSMKKLLKVVVPRLMRGSSDLRISGQCTRSILKIIADLRKLKWPALYLLDASGKLPPGMLSGRLSSLGEYDQCLELVYPANKDSTLFTGQYCTVEMKPPLPPRPRFHPSVKVLPIFEKWYANDSSQRGGIADFAHNFYFNSVRFGVCVPSTCSLEDIRKITAPMQDSLLMDITVPRCELHKDLEILPEQMAVIVVLSILLVLVLAGTTLEIWDVFFPRDKLARTSACWLRRFAECFSVYSNGRAVLQTDMAADTLTFLPGVRFLTVSWIVLGHTYLTVNFAQVRNLIPGRMTISDNFLFQIIINGTVSVDTFFFLSGLLVALTVIKMARARRSFNINIPLFILRRAWRLLPGSMAIMGLFFLTPWIRSGPLWSEMVGSVVDQCHRYWWANLLFVNNHFNDLATGGDACLLHTWFISADFQLHVLSLVVLLPMLRWPKVGLGIATTFILSSCVVSFLVHYHLGLPPIMLSIYPDPKDMHEMWSVVYIQAWNHAGPYFIGMIVGYFISSGGHRRFLRNPVARAAGWVLAVTANLTVLFFTYHWNKGNVPHPVYSLFYAATIRPVWALGLAWMVLCITEGRAVIINNILSWRAFVPLSRLVFMIYLIHYPMMLIFNGMLYEYQFKHWMMVWWFFGHLTISTLLALPACLLFESPFIRLEKLIMGPGASSSTSKGHRKDGDGDKQAIAQPSPILEDKQKMCNAMCKLESGEDTITVPNGSVAIPALYSYHL